MQEHPYPCPLGDDACEDLNKILSGSAMQKYWLDLCDKAGLPQPKLMADCVRRIQIAQGLKDHFFPGRP